MKDTPCILIADDELVNRTLLSWALGEAGYRVLSAADGPQARAMAQALAPDLIILDVLMPGEDGFETCRRLQADPATRAIPVIFLSGLTEDADRARGLELGAVDYVAKPFAARDVVARARLHLRVHRCGEAP